MPDPNSVGIGFIVDFISIAFPIILLIPALVGIVPPSTDPKEYPKLLGRAFYAYVMVSLLLGVFFIAETGSGLIVFYVGLVVIFGRIYLRILKYAREKNEDIYSEEFEVAVNDG